MSQPRARAGAPAFAGLRSFISGGRKAEEDRKTEDDEDEEGRKARRAEEDKRREDEDARRAEEDKTREDEDARRAEEDEKDPKDPDGKKAKGKADEDDETCEDDSDDDDKKAAKAAGRAAENVRWTRVLNHPDAAPHAAAACVMLASTDMHSSAVIAAVKAMGPAPRTSVRRSLDERMEGVRAPNPGPSGGAGAPTGAAATAQAIVDAGKKRRGEK